MKSRKFVFVFILTIISLYIPQVYAKNYSKIGTETTNGWYMVEDIEDNTKVNWAYYENGVEKKRYSMLITAHMGWASAPSNSLASFKLTKTNGFYGNETDIRFTKDNVPVLIHDATINKYARNMDNSVISETINVSDLTLEQIKQYNFLIRIQGNQVLDEYQGNKITTLEEALSWASENNMVFLLELKEGTKQQIESVVKLVEKYNMQDRVVYYSFSEDLLKYVNDYNDHCYLKMLDESEYLDVPKISQEETIAIYNRLNTENNLVYIVPNSYGDSQMTLAPDLPNDSYKSMSKYELPLLVEETETVETNIETDQPSDISNVNNETQTEINVPSTGISIPLYLKIIGVLVVISGVTIIIKVQSKRTS